MAVEGRDTLAPGHEGERARVENESPGQEVASFADVDIRKVDGGRSDRQGQHEGDEDGKAKQPWHRTLPRATRLEQGVRSSMPEDPPAGKLGSNPTQRILVLALLRAPCREGGQGEVPGGAEVDSQAASSLGLRPL